MHSLPIGNGNLFLALLKCGKSFQTSSICISSKYYSSNMSFEYPVVSVLFCILSSLKTGKCEHARTLFYHRLYRIAVFSESMAMSNDIDIRRRGGRPCCNRRDDVEEFASGMDTPACCLTHSSGAIGLQSWKVLCAKSDFHMRFFFSAGVEIGRGGGCVGDAEVRQYHDRLETKWQYMYRLFIQKFTRCRLNRRKSGYSFPITWTFVTLFMMHLKEHVLFLGLIKVAD